MNDVQKAWREYLAAVKNQGDVLGTLAKFRDELRRYERMR